MGLSQNDINRIASALASKGGGTGSKPKAKSGAKEDVIRRGKNADKGFIKIWGWKVNKRHGMVHVKAYQNRGTKTWKSDKGRKHMALIFEVTFKDQGNEMIIPANYCVTTGKAYLDKLGWVVSTQGANGGYVGPVKTKG